MNNKDLDRYDELRWQQSEAIRTMTKFDGAVELESLKLSIESQLENNNIFRTVIKDQEQENKQLKEEIKTGEQVEEERLEQIIILKQKLEKIKALRDSIEPINHEDLILKLEEILEDKK